MPSMWHAILLVLFKGWDNLLAWDWTEGMCRSWARLADVFNCWYLVGHRNRNSSWDFLDLENNWRMGFLLHPLFVCLMFDLRFQGCIVSTIRLLLYLNKYFLYLLGTQYFYSRIHSWLKENDFMNKICILYFKEEKNFCFERFWIENTWKFGENLFKEWAKTIINHLGIKAKQRQISVEKKEKKNSRRKFRLEKEGKN